MVKTPAKPGHLKGTCRRCPICMPRRTHDTQDSEGRILVTGHELARCAGVSPMTVSRAVRAGRIKPDFATLTGTRLFDLNRVPALIENLIR